MMKGLMDRCIAQEILVDRLQERAKSAEMKRNKLKTSWEVQVKKLDVTRKALEEPEAQTEALKKVLKDKEREISSLRKQVRQAKEDGKTEFRNFDGFLSKLGGCYANNFNECLRQVKAFFPDLYVSQVSLDDVAQTPARSVESGGIGELFEGDPTPDVHSDGGAAPQEGQAQFVDDENRPVKEAHVDQPQFIYFLFYCGNYFENNGCVTLTLPTKFFGFFIYKFICFHSI